MQFEVPAGPVHLDRNRQAIQADVHPADHTATAEGKPALRLVGIVPGVEQTFGGVLSEAPPPRGRAADPAGGNPTAVGALDVCLCQDTRVVRRLL